MLDGAARIVDHGGRVAMGAHGNVVGVGFHYEMWVHALGGMANHEVLRSATIVGATAIGHGNDFGSLEPGKLADLQILDRNPLLKIQNTTSICFVMKNGRLYTVADLTEIWPRYRGLPSTYFQDPVREPPDPDRQRPSSPSQQTPQCRLSTSDTLFSRLYPTKVHR